MASAAGRCGYHPSSAVGGWHDQRRNQGLRGPVGSLSWRPLGRGAAAGADGSGGAEGTDSTAGDGDGDALLNAKPRALNALSF